MNIQDMTDAELIERVKYLSTKRHHEMADLKELRPLAFEISKRLTDSLLVVEAAKPVVKTLNQFTGMMGEKTNLGIPYPQLCALRSALAQVDAKDAAVKEPE